MKKLFFTLAILMSALMTINAQEPGHMWVGGSVGLWSSKDKGADSHLSFKVLPEFGYVISDNIGVGISLGGGQTYGNSDLDFANETRAYTTPSNYYRISPFLRYALVKGDIGSLFFDTGVGYEQWKVVNGGSKTYGLDAGIKPGVALNVSEKIALTGKFGFIGYQFLKAGELERNSFGIDMNMENIELGMSLKF